MKLSKKGLIDFLSDRKSFENVDETVIEELLYNLELIKKAKDDINDRGIVCNVSSDPKKEVLQKNHSCSVYDSALKNVLNISRRLGLTPRDRKELELKVEEDDGFGEED